MQSKEQLNTFVLIGSLILFAVVLQLGVFKVAPHILLFGALGVVVFLISFVKINFALVILIFSMLLSPEFGGGAGSGRAVVIRLDDVLILMIFFGWLASMAVNKDLGLIRRTPVNQPIFVYTLICIVASMYGILLGTTNPKTSFFFLLKYIEYFLLFFIVSNNLQTKKQVQSFIGYLLITCMVVSVYALISSPGGRASAPFEGEAGEPNTLAGYLIVMMGMALGIGLYTKNFRLKLVLIGSFLFMTLPLVYTLSRTGWAGFLIMYVSFIVLSRKHKGFLIMALMIMAFLGSVFMPDIIYRRVMQTFQTGRTYEISPGQRVKLDESAAARIRSWQDAFELWLEHPMVGHGVAGGRGVYDMQYARLLREVGIFGTLAFFWIISRLYRIGWRSFGDEDIDDWGRGMSMGFICVLNGLVAMGMGAEVFIIIRIMEPFWFFAAMVVILPDLFEKKKEEPKLIIDAT